MMNEEIPLPLIINIKQIQPGQAIACEYTASAGKIGVFANFGDTTKELITLPSAASDIDGAFFFICVGYTPGGYLKLVADRNIQNISWETLYAAGLCTADGLDFTADDLSPHQSYRLLGSVEWDKILVEYNLAGAITDPEAFYHAADSPSWTLDTALAAQAKRIVRGGTLIGDTAELTSTANSGFRPVLIYNPEPKIKSRPLDETVCPLPLVSEIGKIQPGQAISCEYTAESGKVGQFGNLGRAKKGLLSDLAPETPDGTFYFICVGHTPSGELKFVADRNIQGKISWETLNDAGFCTYYGEEKSIDGIERLRMRLPGTIPNRYVDDEMYGEWDAILSYYDLDGQIKASDNEVWNCLATKSWTAATLLAVDDAGTAADPALRIARGDQDKEHFVLRQSKYNSGSAFINVGFRPVLIYNPEPKIKSRPADETACPLPLVSELGKIQPGQAISCEYTAEAGKVGQFGNLGRAKKGLLSDLTPETPDGTFHFICVGYTPSGKPKLVADRNIQGGISWETLNNVGFCTSYGEEQPIDGIDGLRVRLPGTISDRYVDDKAYGEWDAIFSYYDLAGKIKASDNEVWNCLATKSWTMAALSTVDDAGTAAAPTLRIARGGQDKEHFVLRQSKYDSNSASAEVGFRPVLIIEREQRFLYLKEDGSCYTVNGSGQLEKITDQWALFSQNEKTAAFMEAGSLTIAKADCLAELEKFKILVYAPQKGEKKNFALWAIPQDQVILPAQFFPIENFKRIHQIGLKGLFDGKGKCKIALTTDLKNYKTFQNGAWQNVDVNDIAAFSANGLDSESLASISTAQWHALAAGKAGVGFAFLPMIDCSIDKAEADKLYMQADEKGDWQKIR